MWSNAAAAMGLPVSVLVVVMSGRAHRGQFSLEGLGGCLGDDVTCPTPELAAVGSVEADCRPARFRGYLFVVQDSWQDTC